MEKGGYRVADAEIDETLLDSVGAWTITKHNIVQYYAETYSTILQKFHNKQPSYNLTYYYIDGFANVGHVRDKRTGAIVEGSALRVINQVAPPFKKHFLVELDKKRFNELKKACQGRPDVVLYNGDANAILPALVFPQVRYERFERAFCLLDPYKETTLSWETVQAAATARTLDVLVHFPIWPININVLKKAGDYTEKQRDRLCYFWGDDSWEAAAYRTDTNLFGFREKRPNEDIVAAYCRRLVDAGGFLGTSKPIPMKNSKGNIVYYLVFASSNETGVKAIKSVASRFLKQM